MPRWSVVRLIAGRELRDQVRDRRTMFLIIGLPVLMYPLFVGIGLLFVTAIKEKNLVVAVAGADHLPTGELEVPSAAAAAAGVPGASARQLACRYPPLLVGGGFPERYLASDPDGGNLQVAFVAEADEDLLDRREADAVLIIDPQVGPKLDRRERPVLRVLGREGEENSKLAVRRLVGVLKSWSEEVKAARFARDGLPTDYDSPIELKDPQSDKPPVRKTLDELRDVFVKVVPFLLVMWMLTGSIYPAIDMTAGEKERGTMETLLISPAERTEIVAGKFLAVMAMGFGTAVWNVILMVLVVTIAPLVLPSFAGYSLVSVGGLAACVLAALPLSMLIAACSLSLGVFARSTKEGNYYMVPMFLVLLPLAYWSLSPGMELDHFTSWVPVANALLLQQRLLAVRTDAFPWQHLPAVAASLFLCVSLALWAAVRQFQRESVLFREADTGGWSLFGKK